LPFIQQRTTTLSSARLD
jgi:hypothetical protein